MRKLKIVLTVIFVTVVIFTTVKIIFVHQRPIARYREAAYPVLPGVPRPVPPAVPVEPHPVGARMAIILDDWGTNYGLIHQAVAIGRPLTISIIPHLKYSRRIAEEARKNSLGVMLHMPMEPKKAREKMEPQTILTTTSDLEVIRYLDEALADVPEAEGVNNHTGSKATTDRRIMRLVLSHLKDKGLFFVDSFVTEETVGPDVAREIGILFARRNVFIDNDTRKEKIKDELEAAVQAALKKGQVIVIGHDKKSTLAAISEEVSAIEKQGVRLVLVKELVKKPVP